MRDYYDPQPCLRLSRPIVLAGQIGAGTRLIGRALCARTGLPFVEVDRQIEHEAGRSLTRIAVEESVDRLSSLARSVFERLALQRPWSVIVFDHAWPTPEASAFLGKRVDFVHVERPTDFLFERLEKELAGDNRWLLEGQLEKVQSEADHARLLEQREPLLRGARIMLDAGHQHELAIASILLEALEPVAGAQPL